MSRATPGGEVYPGLVQIADDLALIGETAEDPTDPRRRTILHELAVEFGRLVGFVTLFALPESSAKGPDLRPLRGASVRIRVKSKDGRTWFQMATLVTGAGGAALVTPPIVLAAGATCELFVAFWPGTVAPAERVMMILNGSAQAPVSLLLSEVKHA